MKNHLKIQSSKAFTLIGLVMIIAVSAFLALLLVPMLTRARQVSGTSVCANNLKQLGLGINAYADGNKQLFPPAGLEAQNPVNGGPHSWDSLINKYIGGSLSTNQLIAGWEPLVSTNGSGTAPKIIACPADTVPRPQGSSGGSSLSSARRSYSMNDAQLNVTSLQCQAPSYPTLPTPVDGIGVLWQEQTQNPTTGAGIDFHAPGYPTRVIRDAAGTILLCEHPDGDNAAGSAWMSTCLGPTNTSSGLNSGAAYQLDPNDPWNNGVMTYQAHGNKFNYLFHDNHVSGLTWQQTLSSQLPLPTRVLNLSMSGLEQGMWTIKAGD